MLIIYVGCWCLFDVVDISLDLSDVTSTPSDYLSTVSGQYSADEIIKARCRLYSQVFGARKRNNYNPPGQYLSAAAIRLSSSFVYPLNIEIVSGNNIASHTIRPAEFEPTQKRTTSTIISRLSSPILHVKTQTRSDQTWPDQTRPDQTNLVQLWHLIDQF